MGTHGEITSNLEEKEIRIKYFPSDKEEIIKVNFGEGGHGGGDTGIMSDFVQLVQANGKLKGKTEASVSVQSHVMAFAAEKARLTDQVIVLDNFVKEVLEQ